MAVKNMIEGEHGSHEKTIIVIEGGTAEVWTGVLHIARKLDRLCTEQPDDFRLMKTHRYADGVNAGKIDWKLYEAKAERIIIKEDNQNGFVEAS